MRKETEKQTYHRAKNFRKYLTKPVAWNWEIKMRGRHERMTTCSIWKIMDGNE